LHDGIGGARRHTTAIKSGRPDTIVQWRFAHISIQMTAPVTTGTTPLRSGFACSDVQICMRGHEMLFHADFHIEYPASMSQRDFFSVWAREAEAALGAKNAGVVIDIWKCVVARRVMAVVSVDSLDALDQILLDLPIMKEHGQHVQVDVTPLRRFEDFAKDVRKRLE
jgi:muconolactone D-isomerase